MIVCQSVAKRLAGVLAAFVTTFAALDAGAASERYTWKNVEIGGGGFVTGIVYSPKQQDLAFARTDTGGAYRWDGSARRWVPMMDWVGPGQSNLLGIESIAADPADPNRVYIAAGTNAEAWAANGVLLRSTDQGRTWARTEMPLKMGGAEDGRTIGERLAVDPSQTSVLYFASRNDGLWRSSDYGANWDRVGAFPVTSRTNGVGIGFVVFDPRSGKNGALTQTIYVGVAAPGETMYRSTNAGGSWMPLPGQPPRLLPQHAAVDARGTLYVTYTNTPGPQGITDGAVWKFDPEKGKWTNITPVAPAPETGRFGYAALAVDLRNPGTLLVATIGRGKDGEEIFRSTDEGTGWHALGGMARFDLSPAPYLDFGRPVMTLGKWISDIEIDPFNSDRVIYGTSTALFGTEAISAAESDRAVIWSPRTNGLEQATVQALISPPAGALLLSGMRDVGGFRHDDLAVSPRQGAFGNPVFTSTDAMAFAQSKPEIVVRVGAAQPGKRGAWSTDGGATWTPLASEPRGSGGSGSVAISADGSTIIWTARNCPPQYTRDFGATWKPCRGTTVRSQVVADRVDPTVFYACDGEKMMFSANAGEEFSLHDRSVLPAGRGKLYATPGKQQHLWLAANKSGLYWSTDGGRRLEQVPAVKEAQALGFGKEAPGKDYPAMYLVGVVDGVAGVFRSDDTGRNWVRINDDEHQYGLLISAISGDPRTYGRVFLGTAGRGILVGELAGQ